ncbi:hypothetical protein BGLA2_1240041 [Burkholderia gladioli]|nr:hypothetical protein BGLA2_1240041 [Burkholderia gladioli]
MHRQQGRIEVSKLAGPAPYFPRQNEPAIHPLEPSSWQTRAPLRQNTLSPCHRIPPPNHAKMPLRLTGTTPADRAPARRLDERMVDRRSGRGLADRLVGFARAPLGIPGAGVPLPALAAAFPGRWGVNGRDPESKISAGIYKTTRFGPANLTAPYPASAPPRQPCPPVNASGTTPT